MTTRRSCLGGASSLAFSNLFSPAKAADPNQIGVDTMHPDLILHNGRVTTLDRTNPNATAIAIKDGLFLEVGSDSEILALAGSDTSRGIAKGHPPLKCRGARPHRRRCRIRPAIRRPSV